MKTRQTVTPPMRHAAGRALASLRQGGAVFVQGPHERVDLPARVVREIETLLAAYAAGDQPSVLTRDADLSTQEAAQVLGLSRPTVVKMMDDGRLPFTKPGTHRRVRRTDLMAFKATLNLQRQKALEEMSALSQEMERHAREHGSFDDDMI